MDVTRAVLVCVVLCTSVGADLHDRSLDREVVSVHDEAKGSRVSHRVQLLFPLLLRISSRLATLIPTAVMGVIGIFLFVAFSKKAFLISLLALFLTYLDKYKRDEENAVHIHKINLYDEEEVVTHSEELLHYVRPHRKRGGKYPYRYYPVGYHPRRRFAMRTVPADFQEFLSQSIDAGTSIGHV